MTERIHAAEKVLECLLLAEAVEKVPPLKIFETMVQNWGLRRINIASSPPYTNNSCAKSDSPDFFNSLSHKRTLMTPRVMVDGHAVVTWDGLRYSLGSSRDSLHILTPIPRE